MSLEVLIGAVVVTVAATLACAIPRDPVYWIATIVITILVTAFLLVEDDCDDDTDDHKHAC